jgi:hypothetical protein
VLAERIVAALTARLGNRASLRPAVGVGTVPSADISDRRAFVAVTEACLRKARADGAGGVCCSWQ